jgi:hypothetical protein
MVRDQGRGLGVCPSNPSLRSKGAAGRCEAAGSEKPEAYSLEYVEDFFGPRTTQMLADRLLQQNGILGQTPRVHLSRRVFGGESVAGSVPCGARFRRKSTTSG